VTCQAHEFGEGGGGEGEGGGGVDIEDAAAFGGAKIDIPAGVRATKPNGKRKTSRNSF